MLAWLISFFGRGRGQMIITSPMIYARLAMTRVEARTWESLTAAEQAENAEQQASTGDGIRAATREQKGLASRATVS